MRKREEHTFVLPQAKIPLCLRPDGGERVQLREVLVGVSNFRIEVVSVSKGGEPSLQHSSLLKTMKQVSKQGRKADGKKGAPSRAQWRRWRRRS